MTYALIAFKHYIGAFGNPNRIYYPGCGSDSSPSQGFPNSHITYLDINNSGLSLIRKTVPGVTTVHSQAERWRSVDSFDMVLSIDSRAPFDDEVKDLKIGGHLLISNKMSDRALDSLRFTLIGIIFTDGRFDGRVETGILDKYKEDDPDYVPSYFKNSNRRKEKPAFYVLEKVS
jgi:hypothetical protein